jgi:hypothetical protein
MDQERLRTELEPEEGVTAVVTVEEECLVSDSRAGLTPAQMVEQRLSSVLRSTPLPVSGLPVHGARRTLA